MFSKLVVKEDDHGVCFLVSLARYTPDTALAFQLGQSVFLTVWLDLGQVKVLARTEGCDVSGSRVPQYQPTRNTSK